MTWLFISALDVWFFRDGRPFTAGEGHTAGGLFPPFPHTVQGALRGLILGHAQVNWEEYQQGRAPQTIMEMIGNPRKTGDLGRFAMQGPFLARREDGRIMRLAPLPSDVVRQKEDERRYRYSALRPSKRQTFVSDEGWTDLQVYPLWKQAPEYQETEERECYLREEALSDYLNQKPFDPLGSATIYDDEPRLGTALDYGVRRPVERMLYQARFVRPKENVGLLVWVNLEVFSQDPAFRAGLLPLGGEGRAARFEVVSEDQVVANAGLQEAQKQIKVVLLTPAFFADGWRPPKGDWTQFFDVPSVKLIGAALKRPLYLGGWDLAANNGRGGHKPMRALVPPGSVYFFTAEEPVKRLKKPFTENPPNEPFDKLGFGQAVVGAWSWLE